MNNRKLRLVGSGFCLLIGLILIYINQILISLIIFIIGLYLIINLILKVSEKTWFTRFIILIIILAIIRLTFYIEDIIRSIVTIFAVIIMIVYLYIIKRFNLSKIDAHRNYPLSITGLVGIFLVVTGAMFLIPISIYPSLKSLQLIIIEITLFILGFILIYSNYKSWKHKE